MQKICCVEISALWREKKYTSGRNILSIFFLVSYNGFASFQFKLVKQSKILNHYLFTFLPELCEWGRYHQCNYQIMPLRYCTCHQVIVRADGWSSMRFISFFGMVIVQLCFATLSCSPEGSVKEVEELFKLINQSWKPYKPIDLETFSLGASLTKARNVLLSSKLITWSDYLETWLGSFFFFFFPLLSTFLYQMR